MTSNRSKLSNLFFYVKNMWQNPCQLFVSPRVPVTEFVWQIEKKIRKCLCVKIGYCIETENIVKPTRAQWGSARIYRCQREIHGGGAQAFFACNKGEGVGCGGTHLTPSAKNSIQMFTANCGRKTQVVNRKGEGNRKREKRRERIRRREKKKRINLFGELKSNFKVSWDK
jgi:hypothetical protein